MSNAVRFDSSRPYRQQPVSAVFVLGVFALGLVTGGVLGVSIWQSRTAAVETYGGSANPATATSAREPAPQAGCYAVDVLRVIDGDTFEARVHVWPGQELTTRVRLRGIDAPELKARCDGERRQAEAALTTLRTMLADRDVSIWAIGPDKYFGRVVAQAGTRRTPDISAALLAKGVVRSYSGGRRDGWCDTAMGG